MAFLAFPCKAEYFSLIYKIFWSFDKRKKNTDFNLYKKETTPQMPNESKRIKAIVPST